MSTTQSTPTTAKPVKAGSSAPVDPGTLNPTDPSADPKTPPPVNGKGSAVGQEVQDVTTSVDPNAGQAVADLRHQIGQ